ncbi:MAG: GatB/YqeY domain-containing protein [Bacteriovoracia bacterium]
MPTLKEKLSEAIKTAMKSGQKETLGYARNLHAAIRKKEVDDRVDLDDAGIQKVIMTLAKQRQDSIDQFKKGGREDLVAAETAELSFLQSYLPQQLGDDELSKLVADAVAEAQATTPKDMGKVMKVLLPKVQGRADGKRISEFVSKKLQG